MLPMLQQRRPDSVGRRRQTYVSTTWRGSARPRSDQRKNEDDNDRDNNNDDSDDDRRRVVTRSVFRLITVTELRPTSTSATITSTSAGPLSTIPAPLPSNTPDGVAPIPIADSTTSNVNLIVDPSSTVKQPSAIPLATLTNSTSSPLASKAQRTLDTPKGGGLSSGSIVAVIMGILFFITIILVMIVVKTRFSRRPRKNWKSLRPEAHVEGTIKSFGPGQYDGAGPYPRSMEPTNSKWRQTLRSLVSLPSFQFPQSPQSRRRSSYYRDTPGFEKPGSLDGYRSPIPAAEPVVTRDSWQSVSGFTKNPVTQYPFAARPPPI